MCPSGCRYNWKFRRTHSFGITGAHFSKTAGYLTAYTCIPSHSYLPVFFLSTFCQSDVHEIPVSHTGVSSHNFPCRFSAARYSLPASRSNRPDTACPPAVRIFVPDAQAPPYIVSQYHHIANLSGGQPEIPMGKQKGGISSSLRQFAFI